MACRNGVWDKGQPKCQFPEENNVTIRYGLKNECQYD